MHLICSKVVLFSVVSLKKEEADLVLKQEETAEKDKGNTAELNFYQYTPPARTSSFIDYETRKYDLKKEVFFCYNDYGTPHWRKRVPMEDYGQFSPPWFFDVKLCHNSRRHGSSSMSSSYVSVDTPTSCFCVYSSSSSAGGLALY